MVKEIFVSFGVDIDAVAGWLGSYGGADSPSDIQRGIFAGRTGVPRLQKVLDRADIAATWFIPGHSLETFPDECKALFDAGHEIGAHGYSHENPVAMTEAQEDAVMERSVELITRLTGRQPTGYVAPWWELSSYTPTLLEKFGFSYDHSQQHKDFVPYYSIVGDQWTPIDYSQDPHTWMTPLVHGSEIDLVEIAANWYVDDLPPMMFIKSSPNSHGFVNPRDVEQMWKDQFDWVYRELDYAVFPITIHPDVSGRPQVLLMIERLIEYIRGHEGVRFVTMNEIADDFRVRFPFAQPERPRES
ncbi:polysaccharide deacetylase family protein [Curtobacterium poinsettiae]|uniref:polysaccharide deacetylase family protein n=1 Tax=Curtobacterium poinsettiae TaxID=159612 RepID=UPI00235E9132|nr:polysaccharide deacetylase [Curtobacterium flaccumfaciens]MDD1385313.1 polysaccharide deacetylase [Curtobacterium flaccumfaciens pv. poinsettiae]